MRKLVDSNQRLNFKRDHREQSANMINKMSSKEPQIISMRRRKSHRGEKNWCRYNLYNMTTCCVMLLTVTSLILNLIILPISCQTYEDSDCKHHHQQQRLSQQSGSYRQQRQFNNNNNQQPQVHMHSAQRPLATSGQLQMQQSQQQQHSSRRSTEVEQEEFNLALGSDSAPIRVASTTNYTLLPASSPSTPQSQAASTSGDSQATGGVGSKDHTAQQQSVTLPPENLSNTTPALPSDSIGSPVVQQPPVTTSSSVNPQSGQPMGSNRVQQPLVSEQQQQSQEDRKEQQPPQRHDDSASRTGSGNSLYQQAASSEYQGRSHDDLSGFSNSGPVNRHLSSNAPQPVSSSPSSISIITPLIGSPNQHQQQTTHTAQVTASIGGGSSSPESQQSAMMKPIFVLGNPITERDYNGYDQQQQPAQQPQLPSSTSGDNFQQVRQSVAKPAADQASVTGSQQQEQQQQPVGGAYNGYQAKASAAPKSLPADVPQVPQVTHSMPQHPAPRMDKSTDMDMAEGGDNQAPPPPNTTGVNHLNQLGNDRMGGPPLVYSDGHLAAVNLPDNRINQQQQQMASATNQTGSGSQLQPPSPRLFQGQPGAAVVGNNPRRPSLPPPVNQANAASGFRSPMSPSGPLIGGPQSTNGNPNNNLVPQSISMGTAMSVANGGPLQPPLNSLQANSAAPMPNFYQTSPPYAGAGNNLNSLYNANTNSVATYNKATFMQTTSQQTGAGSSQPTTAAQSVSVPQVPTPLPGTAPGSSYSGRRPLNITRVEHISAECSNDLIRAVIVFNGTFKGIIYSSGYVSDPTCLYVNGTGSTRYEFSIRLNQCGTLGRQELHQPTIPGEARRRDQVMWNTLSIQYNSIIEQEWDEHFRVSCEYGSDFWKTVSFSPFNVETNTGSPVVFTINPPQCQMDVLLGHGMGPKIAVDGPVTVGDPLTLLIHMKSEKAGYDILVKNCVAHNGGKQRMQLIDSNGCVVNERFISPFRGTYNDNDLRHVTLYAYLKAFRFTGSPVLYLECEIHMCQSACPPQMCYWRRLSKRSVDDFEYEYTTNSSLAKPNDEQPVISDSLSLFKALQVRQEPEPTRARSQMREIRAEDDEASLICYRHTEVYIFLTTTVSLLALIITVAITCCLKIRKLTRNQFEHNRLTVAGSLSPSLLSISDAISSAGSIISNSGCNSLLSNMTLKSPSWAVSKQHHQQQQQQHSHCFNPKMQKQLTKGNMYMNRQPAQAPISSFQTRSYVVNPQVSR